MISTLNRRALQILDPTSKCTACPSIIIIQNGHEEMVQLLLEQKPNLSQQDVDKNTALHLASFKGKFACTNILYKQPYLISSNKPH